MTKIVLTPEVCNAGIDTLKADKATHKKWVNFADMMRAAGVASTMLAGETADKDLVAQVKREIIMPSFTKLEQSIYAKPTASLDETERVTKRWVTTEIGSKLGKIARHIKKAEDDETLSDDEKGAKRVADMATRLKRDLTKWIDKVEKAEAVTFSATQMVKILKEASALIK